MSEVKANIASDEEAKDHHQQASSAGEEGDTPNKISDHIETDSAEDTGDADSADNTHAEATPPNNLKPTVSGGGQGESALYYNPKSKSYSRVGASITNMKKKKSSWADAAREDDMTRGLSYEELAQQVMQMNMDSDVGSIPTSTGGSGATEEEKAARRERIRARREERLQNGEGMKFEEDSGATPKYYRTADGNIKKPPGFAREEFLDSIKEGGVPIKSWLVIALAMGFGMYQLRKTTRQAEAKDKRKGGASRVASPAKSRAANKVKMGKKNRPSVVPDAIVPELDFELDPEPKRGPKHAKKIKSTKKKRVRKTTPAPTALSPDAVDNDTSLAKSSTGTQTLPANVASGDNGTDELGLTSYNEDDRRAIMQALSEEGGRDGANAAASSDDGGWLTAGRKSRVAMKQKSPNDSTSADEAKAGTSTNASKGNVTQVVTPGVMKTKDAAPKSKMTSPKKKSVPSASSEEVKPMAPTARAPPKAIDTKKDDAALARALQEQEENMAAREMGMDVEEEWEEVSSTKKKGRKKANPPPPGFAAVAAAT